MAHSQNLASRLETLARLSGISYRALDRCAGHGEGHLRLAISRLSRSESSDIATETLAAYARVTGVDVNWLLLGEGAEPSAAQVQEAVAKAQAVRSAHTPSVAESPAPVESAP